MYKIRQIKYSSKSISIQVYKIQDRKRIIVKHIGTARTEQEKSNLLLLARKFIDNSSNQLKLFEEEQPSNNILNINQSEFIGVHQTFSYELFYKVITTLGFDKLKHNLLLDLVILRIIEPASKLRSIELLDQYFGIKHRRQTYYESALKWLALKSKTEAIAINFAKKNYGFNFDLIFYDVTTLYFESFQEDELRKNGFSKDNKSQQPQILVALMVTKQGFPISYEIFPGNTFEGHTIIPMVNSFINKNNVSQFTVVADAAMISSQNMLALKENNINYIVGARLGNLSNQIIQYIDENLPREDNKSIRIKTDNGYLICSFSALRYRKDKYEMEKQIQKAKFILNNPAKRKKVKFTTLHGTDTLNEKLIHKTQKLLGVKGYYTSLEENLVDNSTIIERYNELYKIEHAFRISKNDLEMRPVFHYKEDPIKLHLLICFIALVISKYIELQTDISIKKIVSEAKKITDARFINNITGDLIKIRTRLTPQIIQILKKLNLLT